MERGWRNPTPVGTVVEMSGNEALGIEPGTLGVVIRHTGDCFYQVLLQTGATTSTYSSAFTKVADAPATMSSDIDHAVKGLCFTVFLNYLESK